MSKRIYDETTIQILEGLEAVRKRPGMYIGSTDYRGLHHLIWEILDNSIDEVMAGYGSKIDVTIHKDNSITIVDEGRGVPTGKHSSGKSTPEVVYTILHSGGKFGQSEGYKTSTGLHGVGASVVNALCEFMDVTIYRNGKIHSIKFSDGGRKTSPLEVIGNTYKRGTKVHFKPDERIFGKIQFNYDKVSERLKESAFLIKGLEINLNDERNDKKEEFFYENGLVAFVEFINESRNPLHDSAFFFQNGNGNIEIEVAFQYCEEYDENTLSFVNNLRTIDGGTHEIGLKSAFTKAFNDYARKNNFLKEKDKNLDGSDIREGLTSIVSIKIPENLLQFEGQTKSKLGTSEAKGYVENMVYEKLYGYLEENKEIAINLIKKVVRSSQAREAARKAREQARKKKKNRSEKILSGKLTPAQSKNKKLNELFVVEGDSAGGSAKQGRDRHHQAILPLRGKVINSERAKLDDLMKNEEIATIVNTIGAGIGNDFELKDSNYNKIIVMTDADTDGAHIQVLILTFLYRFMKPLLENEMVYIACPPLYKVTKTRGKKVDFLYAWDEIELKEARNKLGKEASVQRYKGLGEMNADQLWETTMDPSTRNLIKINVDDVALAERRVSVLMGNKADIRRKWIEDNVDFSLEEEIVEGSDLDG